MNDILGSPSLLVVIPIKKVLPSFQVTQNSPFHYRLPAKWL
ncbi:hypothetical protein [Petrimonas sulfuriphila]